ncbi:hypothetical protein PG994_003915 [Apiospora phragmitis]|uniref:Peptidase C14 caspase domain-containing protein n=1 Tax=Apiospora phragmitis TaxID=2905665 RepID=A0ABR1VZK7_9PEZI
MASPESRHVSTPSPLPRVSEPNPTQESPTQESPIQEYQDEDATQDSKLKALWDSEMGDLNHPYTPYTKVSVLLLSWHKEIDDLKTDHEVTDLENLFKDKFMFDTTRQILTKDSRTSAQAQVNHYLAKFVYENDNTNTMFIIYYAGHGRPGNDRGKLKLTASSSHRGESNTDFHEVVWNSAESNIRNTSADVLVIFDCCHAGELARMVRGNRAFEYLAATSANSTTRKPGPQSFTSALIWSLGHLLEKHIPFSTTELVRIIDNDAPDFPEEQSPRLAEGPNPTHRKIMIAPLTKESIKIAEEAPKTDDKEDLSEERRRDLHLRFTFDCDDIKEPNLIKGFAGQIRNLIHNGGNKAKAVSWEGIHRPSCGPSQYIAPGIYHVNYKDALVTQSLRYFTNSLGRIRSARSERSPAEEPRPLLKNRIEAPLSPASEIVEDQGVSTIEKALSAGDISDDHTVLQHPPNLLDGGQTAPGITLPREPKRKRGDNNEVDADGPAAAAKRRRSGKKA